MSHSKSKQLTTEEMDDHEMTESESSSEEDEDFGGTHPDAYTGNEQVQVDFEGRSPTDPDCHGISQLLGRLFLKAHIDHLQMAETIIAQNYVGSVLYQCDSDGPENEADEDMYEDGTIFGITTVLNLTAKKDLHCIQQLCAYILDRAEKNATDAVLKHFRDVLSNDARPVGFLINERYINIPAEISVPLLENLQKEINTAKQKGMKFNFVYILMMVKLFRKKARKGKPAEDTYTNAEEELICEQSVDSFEYSVVSECDTGMSGNWLEGDSTLIPYRKVILFDAKNLPAIIEIIKKATTGQ